ncbi:MAG TPA: hypothetical protein PLU87_18390 [Sedimentisphaerales bacterium]|nr:hypothetical protein [Sedimentisphaerales bacterium]HRS13013.1 hypothetical protein [Sedimentisphaerales bacterium]HRV49640.1 hypothetical protein [Sedimentisphaerales bacterium]
MRISITTLSILLLTGMTASTVAIPGTWFLDGVAPDSGWRDVNKSETDDDDDYLCWAAAAANILDWGGWNASFSTADAKFENFKYYWSDQGSWPRYGWDWWITGNEPPAREGWAQVEVPGGGAYFPATNFNNVSSLWGFDNSEPGILDMVAVESYLRNGTGVSIGVRNLGFHHALTVWGVDYETDFYTNPYRYTGFWATDSDDNATRLSHFTLSYIEEGVFVSDVWWVQSDDNEMFYGWITGVQGLRRWEPQLYPGPGNLPLRVLVPGIETYEIYPRIDQQVFYAVVDVHPDMPLDPQPVPAPASLILAAAGLSLVLRYKRLWG